MRRHRHPQDRRLVQRPRRGAAAVAAAGYGQVADRYDDAATVVVVLSDANVARETLLTVLSKEWNYSTWIHRSGSLVGMIRT
jgi:threonine dehydratase